MRYLGIALLLVGSFTEANVEQKFNFNVWIDDREIGQHSFDIRHTQGGATVRSKAQMQVKVLFVPVFKYMHEASEKWFDGCLREVESKTKTQGDTFTLVGRGSASTFVLASEKNQQPLFEESFSGCLSSYAYWDRSKLNRNSLMNSQTGEISSAEFRLVGQSQVPKLDLRANQYRLTTAEAVIDLWYDQDDNWAALQTNTENRKLTYVNKNLLGI